MWSAFYSVLSMMGNRRDLKKGMQSSAVLLLTMIFLINWIQIANCENYEDVPELEDSIDSKHFTLVVYEVRKIIDLFIYYVRDQGKLVNYKL